MNNRLGRLLRPGMGVYFVVMGLFCAAALILGQYWLAAAESAVTLVVFGVYMANRSRRDRKIRRYIRSASNTMESLGKGESPFPAVLVRLGDNGIVWTNARFSELTGISDTMIEHDLEELLPGFSTDWLASGKTECPHDVTLDGRRYRVYGTVIRAEDNRGTMLGLSMIVELTIIQPPSLL